MDPRPSKHRVQVGIFCSLRFDSNTLSVARPVRDALVLRGIPTVIVEKLPGQDVAAAVATGLNWCKLVLIFGTHHYGAPGSVPFSTREEMSFVKTQHIPFYLIKMCDQFDDDLTKWALHFLYSIDDDVDDVFAQVLFSP